MTSPLRAAILIVSQTASKDPSTDKCEHALRKVLDSSTWEVAHVAIVADNALEIQRAITGWTDTENAVNLVLTSGGTGFAVDDVTPEAVGPLLHKHAPGLAHAMLASSLAITPFAAMARPVAGVRRGSLILTLPGSPKGAQENLEAVIKLLPHACQQVAGADSRKLHSGGVKQLERDAGIPSARSSGHQHHHHHDHHHGHGHKIPKPHTDPKDRPTPSDPSASLVGRHRESPYPMKTVDEALALIAANVPAPIEVTKPLTEALIGHVLAADVKARESVPAFRASIVDGYAVVVGGDAPSIKGTFPVIGSSTAQAGEAKSLRAGQVTRITTGAPLPEDANAVVMVEDTVLVSTTDDGKEEKEIRILTADYTPGENVREIGSDVTAGDTILRKGEGITDVGGEFGLLASVGTREVSVYSKPVISVLSTGDEIVPYDHKDDLRYGEVRDTNRPTLLQSIKNTGFEGVDMGIASDKVGQLEAKLRDAMRASDVVITTGGVSMGELDLLKSTIEHRLGGTIHFGRVSMKPGKPTTFATVPCKDSDGVRSTKVIFSLPGNPASAVVTYHLFVLPALHAMSGIKPVGLPLVSVVLEDRVRCDAKRQEYSRAIVTCSASGLRAHSTGGQRSSRIGSFKGANGLLKLPLIDGYLEKGDSVPALLLGPLQSTMS